MGKMDPENLENYDPDSHQTALERRRNRFKKLVERTQEKDQDFKMWAQETKSMEKMSVEESSVEIPSFSILHEKKFVESTTSSSVTDSNRANSRLSSDEL